MFNSRAILGAMLGLAASLQIRESGGAHQVIRINDRAAPMQRRQKRGLRYSPKKPPVGNSGDKLMGKIGHIGMGMHSSGITATPVEKGPAQTKPVKHLSSRQKRKELKAWRREEKYDIQWENGAAHGRMSAKVEV